MKHVEAINSLLHAPRFDLLLRKFEAKVFLGFRRTKLGTVAVKHQLFPENLTTEDKTSEVSAPFKKLQLS